MAFSVPAPFVLVTLGSSLSYGRLAAPPFGWAERLAQALPYQPEAIGPIQVLPRGHGGWMSADILADVVAASGAAVARPSHIFLESGDINACVVTGGLPAETRAQKIANQQAMIAGLRGANPAIDITFLTMNPVSAAGAALRPNLADYYADTVATAAAAAPPCGWLDAYANWPHPLPEWMSHNFDGLHPVWSNAVELYFFRQALFLARQKMAAWWGLAAPVAPIYPAAPDVDYLIVAAGAGGGDFIGGGGGAGEPLRARDYLPNLLGPVTVGAKGVKGASRSQGSNGGDSVLGPYRAKGGGYGGGETDNPSIGRGGDGGHGGGGGTPFLTTNQYAGGTPQGLFGMQGGLGKAQNGAGGGGGGATAPGGDSDGANGGVGGPGWATDVPGDPQNICGGGPGGAYTGARPAYPLGGGPTCFGGGGRGGGAGASTTGPGDDGGAGCVWIWYPGAPRCGGGVITSAGGYTVHKFTASGTLA
jgi:hypothetical protein